MAALFSVGFAAATLWELAAPFGAGHVAASTAIGIAAENMLRWHIAAPVTHYTFARPTPSDWYCNHPFGIFWWQLPFSALLGHRDLACRLPPALLSMATPPLVYLVGRSVWGAVAGAVAAAAFAVLPIALAFSAFNALEVPVMFTVLVALWGTVRFAQTGRRRWCALSLGGMLVALQADWSAWIYVAVVLGAAAPRALGGGGLGVVAPRRLRAWWLGGCALVVASALFYGLLFARTGQLQHVLFMARLRTHGGGRSLPALLASRRYWIEVCFTPLGIALGVVAVPIVAARALRRRRAVDALPLAVLVMALVQYLVFTNGADVHIFWPHLFALWFALGMGALAACVADARPRATLVVGLALCLAILPDGLRALDFGRATGLRFDEKGRFIEQSLDQTAALRWFSARMADGTGLGLHSSAHHSWSLDWALERPLREERVLPSGRDARFRYFAADRRSLSAAELQQLGRAYAVIGVGALLLIDRDAPPAPAQGFAIVRREPTLRERVFGSAHDPVMTVAPDPFATWELRQLLAQPLNALPSVVPPRLDARLTAHNAALAAGDDVQAARLGDEILAVIDRRPARRLDNGVELLGVQLEPGVAPRLHVLFGAPGILAPAQPFVVRAEVVRTPAWSMVPPPPSRLVAPPPMVPTSLWRAGFWYESVVELRPSAGRERYRGGFALPADGAGAVELLERSTR